MILKPKDENAPEDPGKWTKSSTLKSVRRVLGPLARVWERDGKVEIGYEVRGKKMILGSSDTYLGAIHEVFVKPLEKLHRAREAMREDLEKRTAEALAKREAEAALQGLQAKADGEVLSSLPPEESKPTES